MRRASFVLPACAGVAACAAVVGLAGACDSSLNLGNGEGGASQVDDAGAPTCASTCDRVIQCGYGRPDERGACLAECAQKARPADLECIARSTCPEIPGCVGPLPDASIDPRFEIEDCQRTCETMHFFDCVDATELSACRGLCETAAPAKRSSFKSCGTGSGGDCPKARDCYGVFQN